MPLQMGSLGYLSYRLTVTARSAVVVSGIQVVTVR